MPIAPVPGEAEQSSHHSQHFSTAIKSEQAITPGLELEELSRRPACQGRGVTLVHELTLALLGCPQKSESHSGVSQQELGE